ncbi:MAG: hypothetical protein AB7C95_00820 [Synergistaceae bacterium]
MKYKNGFEYLPEDKLKAKRRQLKSQIKEVHGCEQRITCGCGRTVPLNAAYKCFYCGLWFCPACAREHFAEHDLEDLLYELDTKSGRVTAETFLRIKAKFNMSALRRSCEERYRE